MKFNKRLYIALMMTIISTMACADYEISWYTINSGGGVSGSANYSLSGVIGQPDAGLTSHEPYVQSGGFWAGSDGCVVNLTDLTLFCQQWLDSGAGLTADLDQSGRVDIVDFSELAHWWYDYCPAGWPIK